jgi:hypothetical protein
MAREIPEVVRAVAGLAATVLDEARKLPETLPGLPVRLIGQALQTSLKLQQQYSGLVARGDEVFTGLRGEAEPGLATFDDDLPAPAGAARRSAFDRVGDLPGEPVVEEPVVPVAEQLADELADDLAVADLPLAEPDTLTEEAVAVLALSVDDEAADLTPAEVAALPDDPAADAVTAVVDELAAEVVDEVAAEVPDAVPDEVLEELTADTVVVVAEEEAAVEEAIAAEAGAALEETAEETVAADEVPVEESLSTELIADAAVGGPPPLTEEVTETVHSVADLTPDEAPEQTELVDDVAPDVAALDEAAEELVDLGGPEAAESVTPGGTTADSAASEPLVSPSAPDQPADGAAEPTAPPTPTSPVEGYDSFSIPALRGHLRAYPAETVADLLDYERATRARAPYITLLQNRLEKLSNDRG